MRAKRGPLISVDHIASAIHAVRGHRIMLDADLAAVYGVATSRLNEQVKRNQERFPPDFMFRLTRAEVTNLMSQSAISRWGGRRKLPLAFTEHGAVMLASVLNSPTAVQASIHVVRAFIQLRGALAAHRDLWRRVDELEGKYDKQFKIVFDAIRELMQPSATPQRKQIGFRAADAKTPPS